VLDRVQELGADIFGVCAFDAGRQHHRVSTRVGSDKRCYLDWMFTEDLATMQRVRRHLIPKFRAQPRQTVPPRAVVGESARRPAQA